MSFDPTVPGGHARPVPGVVFWPGVTPEEAEREWLRLRAWVEHLAARFPHALRLPDCWWRHNDLVEVLAALRDHEYACFGPRAPANGPVDWQRALRDLEQRTEGWVKRFTCSVRGHAADTDDPLGPEAWSAFVAADFERRRRSAVGRGFPDGKSIASTTPDAKDERDEQDGTALDSG